MNRLAIAWMLVASVACHQEADIGSDVEPLTCNDPATASVSGTIVDPLQGGSYQFDVVTGRTTGLGDPATPTSLFLEDGTHQLRFNFYCGSEQAGNYDVLHASDNGLPEACPLAVTAIVGGQIEALVAEGGALIVDEAVGCLAGQFDLEFGQFGALSGEFKIDP